MKQYVFTVDENVCLANNKDVTAANLLEVMKTYGTVEDYDTHFAAEKAKTQAVVDGLVAKYEAIESQKLSNGEIKAVNLLRELIADAVKVYVEKNTELENHINVMKSEAERCANLIMEALGK